MLSKNQLGFLYMFMSVCAFSLMDIIVKWSVDYPIGQVLFFRGFFGEQATVEYPKDELLYVGGIDATGNQGRIGYEYQNRIQDNAIYQIFSVLIKTGLSVSEWSSLYKRFAHPAGFHYAGLVQLEEDGIITFNAQGINPLESSTGDIVILDEATQIITTAFTQITAILDSSFNGDPATDGVFRLTVTQPLEVFKDNPVGKEPDVTA